jgi:hypothetical protein
MGHVVASQRSCCCEKGRPLRERVYVAVPALTDTGASNPMDIVVKSPGTGSSGVMDSEVILNSLCETPQSVIDAEANVAAAAAKNVRRREIMFVIVERRDFFMRQTKADESATQVGHPSSVRRQ